jgi:predicted SprT family Zn-dependent metalloprotease
MMTEREALILMRRELDRCRKQFRCKVLDDYRVEVNRQMRSYSGHYGLCDTTEQRISISAQHVERDSDAEILGTVRHEIAHAITHWDEERKGIKHDNQYKCHHNELFYKWCVKIGCKPQRCIDSPRRPRHADEKPTYSLGCRCVCQNYKRLPKYIRTDETGRAFTYSWTRHEYWDSEELYMEYYREKWVKNNHYIDERLKPSRLEWELERNYLRCQFHYYRHDPREKPCNQPVYLYPYNDGYRMWYFGNPIRNFKIDEVPPKDCGHVVHHYPGQEDERKGEQR